MCVCVCVSAYISKYLCRLELLQSINICYDLSLLCYYELPMPTIYIVYFLLLLFNIYIRLETINLLGSMF